MDLSSSSHARRVRTTRLPVKRFVRPPLLATLARTVTPLALAIPALEARIVDIVLLSRRGREMMSAQQAAAPRAESSISRCHLGAAALASKRANGFDHEAPRPSRYFASPVTPDATGSLAIELIRSGNRKGPFTRAPNLNTPPASASAGVGHGHNLANS
jgi:hypothetical protein